MKHEDIKWMSLALSEAKKANTLGEVPVGAVLVGPDGLIAKAHNLREKIHSPLGHAEVLAIHRAAKKLARWRLEDCTLYVTLEPCSMCLGAIKQARIKRLVFGAMDEKEVLTHNLEIAPGVMKHECSEVLSRFFSNLREEKKTTAIDRHVSSVFVFHENKILSFLAVDPFNQKEYAFLPGGKIEDSESPEETAIRETKEETGYKIKIIEGSHFYREYLFNWNNQVYRRKTEFMCAVLNENWHEPTLQKDESYNLGPRWVSFNEAEKTFGHHPAISMSLKKALKFWKRSPYSVISKR